MKNNKYILGGGISGLIHSFYNPGFQVITENIGGKLKNGYMKSTILLHDTPLTRRFLDDIGIKNIEPRKHTISYLADNKIVYSITQDQKNQVVRKKLTAYGISSQNATNLPIRDTTLSVEGDAIPTFEIDLEDIVKKLLKSSSIINDSVVKITENEIFTNQSRFGYDEIVSTVSAPIFWSAYGQPRTFDALSTTFIVSDTPPPNQQLQTDLTYFIDLNVPYTRVNKNKDGTYLYEITGSLSKDSSHKILPGINLLHHFIDPSAVIHTDLNNVPPPKIRFSGRFATWNHKHKIQHTIADALANCDFTSIWNKQREFNTKIVNYNNLNIEQRQHLTKEFILHIQDEAHEILHEINWKLLRNKDVEVRRDKLVEEWIDLGKLWMGLGNLWDISLDEFAENFWKKTKMVEARDYRKTT